MIPTAADILAEIASITGEANERGEAAISINVTNVAGAKTTLARIKGIKKKLKLLKREAIQTQSHIRAVNVLDETNTFLSDLLERHISQRLDSNSRKAISVKKNTLISLYKHVGFVIDKLILKIDEMIIQLDDYVLRNR